MNARIQRIPSRVLSVALLSAAVVAASAIEARAACVAPTARVKRRPSAQHWRGQAGAPGNSAGAGCRGAGRRFQRKRPDRRPVAGCHDSVSGHEQCQFVFDVGFQQFHSDGTELMISGGVPPTIGNVCIGVWEREAGGVIRLRHMTWNWAGNEVLGDVPTGYFLLDVTLRTDSQGAAYSGTWRAASFDLGAGPLGSGGPAQPGSEFEGTLQAVRISGSASAHSALR